MGERERERLKGGNTDTLFTTTTFIPLETVFIRYEIYELVSPAFLW